MKKDDAAKGDLARSLNFQKYFLMEKDDLA
jgi:hypothetical protein